MYTCRYYTSLFLVCHQLGSTEIVCIHVFSVPSMSSVMFHGYSMYTCSYYRSLFLVCHQFDSMAIVCIHVDIKRLCS